MNQTDEILFQITTQLTTINGRLDGIDNRLDGIDNRLDGIGNRLDGIDNRLDKLDSEMSAVKTNQLGMRKDLKQMSSRIEDVYQMALDNWGQIVESKVRLDLLEKNAR